MPKVGHGDTHEHAQVHGVTALEQGSRSTLFLCQRIEIERDLYDWAMADCGFYARLVTSWDTGTPLTLADAYAWCNYVDLTGSEETVARFFVRQIVGMFSSCETWEHTLHSSVQHYLLFLQSVVNNPGAKHEPSALVDFIWHTHLTRKHRYTADCIERFGVRILHSPN